MAFPESLDMQDHEVWQVEPVNQDVQVDKATPDDLDSVVQSVRSSFMKCEKTAKHWPKRSKLCETISTLLSGTPSILGVLSYTVFSTQISQDPEVSHYDFEDVDSEDQMNQLTPAYDS